MHRSARQLRYLSTVLIVLATPAFAQRNTAQVSGTITDASESAVPGASIVVRNLNTAVERTVESNELGLYVVPALTAGPYSITVTKQGFQTTTVPKLVLEVDQNATINVSLKVGQVSEAVNVSADAAAIDTRTATFTTPAALASAA